MKTENKKEDATDAQVANRFLKFTFFKVAREYRTLGQQEKSRIKDDFLGVLTRHEEHLGLQCFSLVGLRGDVDFMVMADAEDLQKFQHLLADLMASSLGRYLDTPYSYLAMTRRSHYLGKHRHLGQDGVGPRDQANSKYLFVYPFVKKREWYRLPFKERERIMADHFRTGHKYPKIRINTGYSFGLDDQEFVLAFEGDDPSEFLALVEELRGSESSMYTQLETPIFTCARAEPLRMLDLIG